MPLQRHIMAPGKQLSVPQNQLSSLQCRVIALQKQVIAPRNSIITLQAPLNGLQRPVIAPQQQVIAPRTSPSPSGLGDCLDISDAARYKAKSRHPERDAGF